MTKQEKSRLEYLTKHYELSQSLIGITFLLLSTDTLPSEIIELTQTWRGQLNELSNNRLIEIGAGDLVQKDYTCHPVPKDKQQSIEELFDDIQKRYPKILEALRQSELAESSCTSL